MGIDYARLRNVTARDITRALLRDGFTFRRQAGSHHRYVHTDGRRVTVSFSQPGDTFPVKTVKSMIERQARWNQADLIRLELL
jgi:predicted RNA binding protein YcfA (HicA-like mRNA interferase family)